MSKFRTVALPLYLLRNEELKDLAERELEVARETEDSPHACVDVLKEELARRSNPFTIRDGKLVELRDDKETRQ